MTSKKTVAAPRVVATIIASMLLIFGIGAPAMADAIDDVSAVDQQFQADAMAFTVVYSDQSASAEDAATAASDFQQAAASAQHGFEQVAGGTDEEEIVAYAEEFARDAGDMSDASGEIADAFAAQDAEALAGAEESLWAAMDAYNATVDDYNEYLTALPVSALDDPAFTAWLNVLIIAVAFFLLSLVVAIVTRKQTGFLPPKTDKRGKVQQVSLRTLRLTVVGSAALFVVGAAIPFFQIIFAQPDANGEYTYRIFWYPLAVGAVLTVVGVVRYFLVAAKVRREGSAPQHDPSGAQAMPVVATTSTSPASPPPASQGPPPASSV